MGHAHLLGALDRDRVQPALPVQPGQGPDRPLDRLRPAHPDRLRPGRPGGGRGGRQGRGAGGPPRPHGPAPRRDPGGIDEHVDDHQRHRGMAARPLHRQRRRPRRRPPRAVRDHPERHREGVPLEGDVHLPPGPQPAAHRGHHRLHGPATSPSGIRSTSAATTSRRRGPPPTRRSPTHWPPPSGCSTRCASRARSPPTPFPRWSGGSPSSSTRGCGSSRRPARCGPSPSSGTGSARSATGSPTPSSGECATGCRSTRSGSPRPSPRTTCPGSCSRRSA